MLRSLRVLTLLVALGLAGPTSLAQLAGKPPTRAGGLLRDDTDYERFPVKAVLTKGNFENLPARVSYEAFCPPVADQDTFPTCVAFATTYYLRSIIDGIQRHTPAAGASRSDASATTFSPSYILAKTRRAIDPACQPRSCRLPDAFYVLRTFGAPRHDALPYPGCDTASAELDRQAAPGRIADVVRLFGLLTPDAQKVLSLKKALSEGYPVVVGMLTPLSFHLAQTYWQLAPTDVPAPDLPGHALCVIGYDDARGAFRVVNSWGTDWADNGFCWVRYADLARFTLYGFQAFPHAVAPTAMSGSVAFRLRDGNPMPTTPVSARAAVEKGTGVADDPQSLLTYRLTEPYAAGTAFKLLVTNNEQAYIYVVGTDQTYRMNRLFPYADGVSARLGPNTTVAYPSDTKSIVLDGTKGTDYVVVLFSRKELNTADLIERMQRATGTLSARVVSALGHELVPAGAIRYQPDTPAFTLTGPPTGSVVPLLVAIEHH